MMKKIRSYDGVNELMIQILMREGPMDYLRLYDKIMETGLLSKRVMLSRRQVMGRLICLECDGYVQKVDRIKIFKAGKCYDRIVYGVKNDKNSEEL